MNSLLQHQNLAWEQVVAKGVYFYYTPADSPEKTHYPHGMICLAEGLRELGIPVYASDDIDAIMERLFYEPTILQSVAEEGQKWVMKHYSPKPVAVRFLETLYGNCPISRQQRTMEV